MFKFKGRGITFRNNNQYTTEITYFIYIRLIIEVENFLNCIQIYIQKMFLKYHIM